MGGHKHKKNLTGKGSGLGDTHSTMKTSPAAGVHNKAGKSQSHSRAKEAQALRLPSLKEEGGWTNKQTRSAPK
jgi:hypothetical protein